MLHSNLKQWVADKAAAHHGVGSFDVDALCFSLIHRSDRAIYRVDVPDIDSFLVLKVRLRDQRGVPLKHVSSNVTDEYERTLAAYDIATSVGEQAPALPHPLAVSEERDALLLTGCEGREFGKYLNGEALSWPFHRSSILGKFRFAGVWLGCFHSGSSTIESGTELIGQRTEHLNRMLSIIDDNSVHGITCAAIAAKFAALSGDRAEIPVAFLHGNFALRNLLVAESSISAIDFEDSRTDCVYFDLGQFVAEIIIRGFVPSFSTDFIGACQTHFLDGYSEQQSIERRLLNAYIGYHLIAFYCEHLRRKTRSPLVAYRRKYIGGRIQQWVAE